MADRARSADKKRATSDLGGLSYRFQDPGLLERALTHRSLSFESTPEKISDPTADNEQMEFVGDAVLGLVIADSLFRRFPESREGELTRLRASVVSRGSLAGAAARVGLGDWLRLGRGEEQSGGRRKPALLANAMEAVIAALYLDGGLEVARRFVEEQILDPAMPMLRAAVESGGTFSGAIGDYKSALQEWMQANGMGQPQYVLVEQSGPDHQKRFRVRVCLTEDDGGLRVLGESDGSTKKQAQQEAARMAMDRLTETAERPRAERRVDPAP